MEKPMNVCQLGLRIGISSLLIGSINSIWWLPVARSQGVSNPEDRLMSPQPPNPTFRPRDVVPQTQFPPNFDPLTSQQFNLYRLDVGDRIQVNVRNFSEFSFGGQIDPEGNLFVPILGRITVVGMTLDEVETKVAYELGQKFLQEEPEVLAVLTGVRPVGLTVIGEIVRPGYYAFAQGVGLNNIITTAGGGTEQADLRSVVVRRTLIDGTVLEETIDLYTPLIRGRSLPNIRLQGGDTIIVKRLNTETARDYDRALIANTNLTQQSIVVRVLIQNLPSGEQLRNVELPSGSSFLDLVGLLPSADALRIKRNEVTLLRFDPDVGRIVTQKLNPRSLVLDGDFPQAVLLRDNDVIVTSRTLLGKILAAFRVLTQPIRDVSSFFFFFDRLFDGNNNNRN
ncbi:MAG: polysaccharide biosynthesis/export family protein [Microcystaceae cyanobacterium]